MSEREALTQPPILLAQSGSMADQILGPRAKPKPVDKVEEAPKGAPVKDDTPEVVLKLSFNDVVKDPSNTKFDDLIRKTVRYNTIELTDVPKDLKFAIQHWKDDKGYFFWFKKEDGSSYDGKQHYYPGNLMKIKIAGTDKVQDVAEQRKKVDDAIAKKVAGSLDVRDGVMTLSIKDGDFDKKLASTDVFDTLKITDLPKDAKLEYGLDRTGFYFKGPDGKVHYFKGNLRQVSIDGVQTNMNQERMKAVEKFAKDGGRTFGSQTADRTERKAASNSPIPQDRTVAYLKGLSKLGGDSLNYLDKTLTEMAESKAAKDDPFYGAWTRYTLANIKAGQAFVLVGELALANKSINDKEVHKRLDKAIELLGQVNDDSGTQLDKVKRRPSVMAPLMPMDPWGALGAGKDDGYYMFWGGCYDQSGWLKMQLNLVKRAIESNFFRIPPERPE